MKTFNLLILFCIGFILPLHYVQAQNNALNFDGSDDFVRMNSNFDAEDAFNGEFTIEFWVKTSSLNEAVIMSKWNEGTDGTFIIETTEEGEITFSTDLESMESDKVIADNQWHHVTIVKRDFSGSYLFTMWIDAIEQTEEIFLGSELTNTPSSFYLARDESNTLTPFRGELDELRIWSIPRDCPDIYSNMRNELTGSETGLVLYHNFNQGTAAGDNNVPIPLINLVDISSFGQDGTLNNFALIGSESNWVASTNGVNSGNLVDAPKIDLRGNNVAIQSGHTTPNFEDNTDFGAVNGPTTQVYDINNLGVNSLSISSITSDNTGSFDITSFSNTISSCTTGFINIEYDPSQGPREATITIISNDPSTPYTFTVQGRGVPEISITGLDDFGVVDKCESVVGNFTISNTGLDDLILYGGVRLSGNSAFKVLSEPTLSTIPPDGTATFEVEYSPTQNGFQPLAIFINSNAGTEYFFTQGVGNTATYPDYEWEVVGDVGFSAENTQFHSLKISNSGTPYVAFQEGASQKTSVMKYNGSTWEYVGQEISADRGSYQSLAIDDDENLYVAYQDGSNDNATTIQKYDGASWTTLGSAISGINNEYQNIALDAEGNIFVAFRNENGKAKVMTYTGSNWENVGVDGDGFSSSTASYVSLAISSNGDLYVAYKDESNATISNQGTTLKYFGEGSDEWENYDGSNFFFPSTQQHLALDTYGSPYIYFLEDGNSSRVIHNTEGWNNYGSNPSTSTTAIGNLVVDISGAVFRCFKDDTNGDRATVQASIGNTWEDIGTFAFSEGAIEDINLAIDNNGILYVAYKDLTQNGKTTVMTFIPEDDEPEINVQGNYQDIVSGSTTPTVSNDTDFGLVSVNVSKTVTYTIHNTGDLELNIYSIEVGNNPQGDFFINNFSPTNIDEGDSITFDVIYFSQFPTTSTATITINSSDCDERPYTFDVTAIASVPVFELYENTTLISNVNPGTSTFGDVFRCGNGITKTFTIKNDGNIDLEISSFTQNGSADFTVVGLSSPSPIIIPAQASRNFTVTFTPSSTTTQSKSITINNTDLNANPYTFSVTGTGQNDTEAPVLIPLQNVTRNMDSLNCFYTNLATNRTQFIIGTAIDDCSVAYSYVLSGATTGTFPSLTGIQFNKGVTTINWNATDVSNNVSASSQFTVTVVDNRNPIIQAPDDIFRETDLYSCGADSTNLNLGVPIVSDNCLFRVFNDAPAEFPIGETVVIWTAIDSAGNTATAEQIVSITDPLFVTPSDSLILVDIYNQTGGQNWARSWNLAAPVSTWNGININCGGIASINLSNNNLTGVLPRSVLNLTQINEPNFSLQIGGNRLGFESAEDFVGQIPNFSYAPQAKIYAPFNEIISQGDEITFTSGTEGDFNSYQWYKGQSRINGATSPTLTITNAQIADAGIYVCEVKNSVATRLTLERHTINLTVEGFLNPTDSIALVRIYEETGGNTTWNTRWDLNQRVATWEGITLSGDKLLELDLSSFGLTGTLPNVFDAELFSELRYLSFFDNELEGQIPATIGGITTLTYLDLDKNNFEGAVPASFGNLVNLQALWLSRNNLTSLPDEIGNLRSLQNLYLNDNKFSSLPETIGNLSELLVLNVSDNDLTGLPNSITNLRRLVQFYANRNFIITLPIGMENLTSLVIFEINTNDLTSLNTALLQLTNLRELKVGENKLEFDDLLPFVNRNFSIFDYAPQAPINEEIDILTTINSSVAFTVTTQGNGNRYQWLRDGNPVSTLQTFTINRVRNTDAGLYIALITNSSLPDLTLQRRSILLNIECQAGLNFEINQPQQTVFCEGQPFGLKLSINDEFIPTSQIRWRKDGVVLAFANEKSYTVTQAGSYTAEVVTVNGCTALSNQIEITVIPQIDVTISLATEGILESNVNSQEPVTYQWLKDGNPIESGFESTYTPTQTGEYSLLVLTESGCSSVSESIIFTGDEVTGIEEPKELRNITLFPNPNNGSFFIDFGTITPNGEPNFVLIDAIGRKINIQTERISSVRYKAKTNNLAGGIYYLQIQTQDGIAFRKFVIEE